MRQMSRRRRESHEDGVNLEGDLHDFELLCWKDTKIMMM